MHPFQFRRHLSRSSQSQESARRRVLAEWRRTDLEAAEQAKGRRIRGVGELMPRVLEQLGLERRRTEAEVARVWNHLMDPEVVSHAQPTGLRRGTLFISVDSNVWLDEIIRYRRHEILERLQHAFGADFVARLSFRVG